MIIYVEVLPKARYRSSSKITPASDRNTFEFGGSTLFEIGLAAQNVSLAEPAAKPLLGETLIRFN